MTKNLKPRDYTVLGYFRKNARTTLTDMSRETRIPVSTIFDKLKRFEERDVIQRHTSIIDFDSLGYDVRTNILLRAKEGERETLKTFLTKHAKVNTINRISNGFDFLVDAVFRDMKEYDEFHEELRQLPLRNLQEFFVMEDLGRERFLQYKKNIGVVR